MSNVVKFQSTKDSTWRTSTGEAVPVKFLPKSTKTKETVGAKIYKAALAAEQTLIDLHKMMQAAFTEIDRLVKAEYQIKYEKEKRQGKGGLTWYNHDMSLKVEASVDEVCKWDAALMTEARTLLDAYLSTALTETHQLISDLVLGAFSNNKGTIDSKKVFLILKHQNKIKNAKYQKACELIKQAQGVDKTKLYMRAWAKQDDGQYRNINLNFSNI
jgi:hypothetical protein